MSRDIDNVISELMDVHVKLWDIVDMLNSGDDDILVKATRMDNMYNRLRSDLVEEIDTIIIGLVNINKGDK